MRCPAEISGPISARLVGRVEHAKALHRDLEEFHEALVGRGLDEDPRSRAAVLAGVVEDRRGRAGGGALQVGVGEDDVGALAAEFERHALDLLGAARHHPLAHVARAGEADLAHGLVRDEAPAHDAAVTGQYLEDALGESGLESELCRGGSPSAA